MARSDHRKETARQVEDNIRILRCHWCNDPFSPRKSGGDPQKFCLASCRHAYGTAARRWVRNAILDGRLRIGDLQDANTACAVVSETRRAR